MTVVVVMVVVIVIVAFMLVVVCGLSRFRLRVVLEGVGGRTQRFAFQARRRRQTNSNSGLPTGLRSRAYSAAWPGNTSSHGKRDCWQGQTAMSTVFKGGTRKGTPQKGQVVDSHGKAVPIWFNDLILFGVTHLFSDAASGPERGRTFRLLNLSWGRNSRQVAAPPYSSSGWGFRT